jgi:PhnB protein
MSSPAPFSYSTVCPYLIVESVEKQIAFLHEVFGAEIKESLKNGEGIIMHGEVKIGDTVIMIGRGSAGFSLHPAMNYVYVQDVNLTYNKAIETGAASVYEPADRFYGVREAGFKDMHNNTWYVAQHVKDVSVEEMEKGFANKKA